MLGIRSWSNRRKAAAAATLAFLLWFPTGISESTGPVVTGHSTYYKGKEFDPCLASIVGVMQTDVRWFNDMVLARRYGGKGTFVYITENGSADPRSYTYLFSDGVSYDFVDPNGAAWHVEELYAAAAVGAPSPEVRNPQQPNQASVEYDLQVARERTYVWVVELSSQPIYDQFAEHLSRNDPNWHTVYNFVALVDTCKMNRNAQSNYNGNKHNEEDPSNEKMFDFNITHDKDDEGWANGHKPDDPDDHEHEAFLANIYVGKRPVIAIGGAEDTAGESSTWESSWTTSSQSQDNAQQIPQEALDGAQGGASP